MIAIKVELNSIYNFQAWSGGKSVLDRVIEKNRADELDALLEDICEDWTDTQLNDFLWFDLPEMDSWTNLWNDDEDEEELEDDTDYRLEETLALYDIAGING